MAIVNKDETIGVEGLWCAILCASACVGGCKFANQPYSDAISLAASTFLLQWL